MSYKHLLPLLGLALIAIGLFERGWRRLLVWLGGDFLILGLAQWRHVHHVFGKRADGTLPLWSWLLFLPLLAFNLAVWHVLRLLSREPAHTTVTDNLVVGRRLLAAEVDGNFDNYVDLTAEFVEPSAIRRSPAYRPWPLLDGSAPTPDALPPKSGPAAPTPRAPDAKPPRQGRSFPHRLFPVFQVSPRGRWELALQLLPFIL
jgi:hypothetical protein